MTDEMMGSFTARLVSAALTPARETSESLACGRKLQLRSVENAQLSSRNSQGTSFTISPPGSTASWMTSHKTKALEEDDLFSKSWEKLSQEPAAPQAPHAGDVS